MKTVTIDFAGVNNRWRVHDVIKESFQSSVEGFPDFCGRNADALWDCLTGFIETPVNIVVKGLNDVPADMRDYVGIILETFKDATELDWIDIYCEIVS